MAFHFFTKCYLINQYNIIFFQVKVEEEFKSTSSSNILDLSKPDGKALAKEKARAKAASGSKNISSFFKKA